MSIKFILIDIGIMIKERKTAKKERETFESEICACSCQKMTLKLMLICSMCVISLSVVVLFLVFFSSSLLSLFSSAFSVSCADVLSEKFVTDYRPSNDSRARIQNVVKLSKQHS